MWLLPSSFSDCCVYLLSLSLGRGSPRRPWGVRRGSDIQTGHRRGRIRTSEKLSSQALGQGRSTASRWVHAS